MQLHEKIVKLMLNEKNIVSKIGVTGLLCEKIDFRGVWRYFDKQSKKVKLIYLTEFEVYWMSHIKIKVF